MRKNLYKLFFKSPKLYDTFAYRFNKFKGRLHIETLFTYYMNKILCCYFAILSLLYNAVLKLRNTSSYKYEERKNKTNFTSALHYILHGVTTC